MQQWGNAQEQGQALIAEGWRSPNTYDAHFAPLIGGSAIYLFQLIKTEAYTSSLIAYAGMSTRLERRISGHNILPLLDLPGFWTKIWFKPTPIRDLRAAERHEIQRFDPPWNIVGRRRGLSFSPQVIAHG